MKKFNILSPKVLTWNSLGGAFRTPQSCTIKDSECVAFESYIKSQGVIYEVLEINKPKRETSRKPKSCIDSPKPKKQGRKKRSDEDIEKVSE